MVNTPSGGEHQGTLLINLSYNGKLINKDDRPYLSQAYVDIILYMWKKISVELSQMQNIDDYDFLSEIMEFMQVKPDMVRPIISQGKSIFPFYLDIAGYSLWSQFSKNQTKIIPIITKRTYAPLVFIDRLIQDFPDFFQQIYVQYEQFSRDYKIPLQDLEKPPFISRKPSHTIDQISRNNETVSEIIGLTAHDRVMAKLKALKAQQLNKNPTK